MSEDDNIEVDVASGKVSVGGTGAVKITNAIVDLLSPFSQTLGFIGDKIRIYRENSAANVLLKAKRIAEKSGTPPSKVHAKNLIPLLENASLESSDDNELAEVWARLLLSGGEKFDSQLAVLTDSLKRLGPREVQFLSELGQSHGSSGPMPFLFSPKNRVLVSNLAETLIPKNLTSADEMVNFAQRTIREAGLSYGKIIYGYFENEGKGEKDFDGPEGGYYPSDSGLEEQEIATVLGKEALVDIVHLQGLGTNDLNLGQGSSLMMGQTTYVELTLLGIDLLKRCDPKFALKHGKKRT